MTTTPETKVQFEKDWQEINGATKFRTLACFIQRWKKIAIGSNINVAILLHELIDEWKKENIMLDVFYETAPDTSTAEYQEKLAQVKLALLPILKEYHGITQDAGLWKLGIASASYFYWNYCRISIWLRHIKTYKITLK